MAETTQKLYSLFCKDEDGWARISTYAFTSKSKASRHWQNALLAYALGGMPETRIKKVKKETDEAATANRRRLWRKRS